MKKPIVGQIDQTSSSGVQPQFHAEYNNSAYWRRDHAENLLNSDERDIVMLIVFNSDRTCDLFIFNMPREFSMVRDTVTRGIEMPFRFIGPPT
jgi:hypothetical protein